MLHRPNTERQAEAMLLLGDDLWRQEILQGLLEEPAQGQPLEFEFRVEAQREINQAVVEQRKTDLQPGQDLEPGWPTASGAPGFSR